MEVVNTACVTPFFRNSALTALAANLATPFVYSHDAVSWLSLGSVWNLKNAALWLCKVGQGGRSGMGCCDDVGEVDGRGGGDGGSALGGLFFLLSLTWLTEDISAVYRGVADARGK